MQNLTFIPSGGVVIVTIKVNGGAIPGLLSVESVRITKAINQISRANVSIIDGEMEWTKLDASASTTFVPGATITIEGGYDSKQETLFEGIITSQSINVGESGATLDIECSDPAVQMTVGRNSQTFSAQTDSDILRAIIGNYSGLTPSVSATQDVWPKQVQHNATDWDFMLTRAEANAMVVTTLNGTVNIISPTAQTNPVITVGYGAGLISFHAELNSLSQYGNVKASVWDYKTQEIVSVETTNSMSSPGNLSASTLAKVAGLSDYVMQTTVPLETANLTNWINAQIVKSTLAKIQGTAKFQGTNLVDPGKYVSLQGLGERFSGTHIISGVTHDFNDGNWLTEARIGLSADWFSEQPDLLTPPASGMLPAARGLFNGTVKQMHDDPETQYRILVDVPMFDPNGEGIWARLSNFYSTNGAGAFFLPEVGDEVILGFLNEDPRYPIILGSVYSGTKQKPFTGLDPNEKNSIKAIVSKSGMSVAFDDENIVLTIVTPDKNTLILSDKDKQITLQDENQNSIVMSASGITIKSAKDINIQADQKISLTGMQGITAQSSGGDIELSGVNIKETAQAQYSANGNAMAQVQGGAELVLKGGMIMIN